MREWQFVVARCALFLLLWWGWWLYVPALFYTDIALGYVALGRHMWPIALLILLLLEYLLRTQTSKRKNIVFLCYVLLVLAVYPLWAFPIIFVGALAPVG